MNLRPVTVVLALLVAVAGFTGCGHRPLFAPLATARQPKPCTLRVQAPPSAVAILVHRDSATSRAELKAILLAAEPNEHFFLFKAATGKLIGSFRTPPGPALPGPPPPAPLPSDPTQVQSHAYSVAVVPYDKALLLARTRLHLRWMTSLTTWADEVISKATAPPWRQAAPNLPSEVLGLIHGLTAAGASLTSLGSIPGIHLAGRVIVAILGLEKVPTSAPPPLPSGLQGATVVVAGFTGNSDQEATWQADWGQDGARQALLLTPSTDDELPAVVAPVLMPAGHDRTPTCAA